LLLLALVLVLGSHGSDATESRWRELGDGTAVDDSTGLGWKRCSEGQRWQDGRCSDDALGHDHQEAILVAAVSGFAGHDDWRLPTLAELRRLRVADAPPLIDAAIFPDTPATTFWSASAVAHGTDGAFVVHFSAGSAAYGVAVPNERHAVRLVRSVAGYSDDQRSVD